jgi:hypothetical protein
MSVKLDIPPPRKIKAAIHSAPSKTSRSKITLNASRTHAAFSMFLHRDVRGELTSREAASHHNRVH